MLVDSNTVTQAEVRDALAGPRIFARDEETGSRFVRYDLAASPSSSLATRSARFSSCEHRLTRNLFSHPERMDKRRACGGAPQTR